VARRLSLRSWKWRKYLVAETLSLSAICQVINKKSVTAQTSPFGSSSEAMSEVNSDKICLVATIHDAVLPFGCSHLGLSLQVFARNLGAEG
jgi:hypothetical protein